MDVRKVYVMIAAAIVLTSFIFYDRLGSADKEKHAGADAFHSHAFEQALEAGIPYVQPGSVSAPELTLRALDGQSYTLGQKTDKPVLLNFWASWCEACSVESPLLNELYERYRGQVDFYGINLTAEEQQAEDIEQFLSDNHIEMPTLLDEHRRATQLYDLHALPTTFLLDADGRLLDTFHLVDAGEFEQRLQAAISW